MTALEKIRAWVSTFPDFDILGAFQVDYTDQIGANCGGIFPSGLVEVARQQDIVGNTTATNQYSFGIHCVLLKPQGDDIAATINADWIMAFQEWVQEQSILGLAPTFGDEAKSEKITAQNGVLYEANNEGMATYMVQLSVQFKKTYEVRNKWLT